jgi:hypothetical protein
VAQPKPFYAPGQIVTRVTETVIVSKSSENKRPGAAGHRFGPDLSCSECKISWEAHQRDPQPCERAASNQRIDPVDHPPENDKGKLDPD